jgi:PAS domain S-box-containing protein
MASSRTESQADEAARLAALTAYGVLDTPPEAEFDDIVLLARTFCGTPMALVSLVGADRQWFKARAGIELTETPIDQSVCAHAIKEREILVIPDLTLDPRTRDNPLVTGQAHLRFYAGAVLRTPRGEAIGALCVIDTTPRPGGLTPEQTGSLLALGRQTMAMLQFRRALRSRDNAARLQLDRAQAVDSAQQAAGVGTFEIDVDSNSLRASPEFCRLFGLPPTPSMDTSVIEAIVIAEDRDKVSTLATRTGGTAPPDAEYRIRRANDGELRWLSRRGEFERDAAGRPLLLRGAVHDITERKQVEMAQETLNSEISHRIKNTLAMVDAIALQTLRHAADRTAVQDFSRRLQALGRAHDILIGRALAGADLQATVTAVAGVIADPGRLAMNGPRIILNARTVLSFSLLIHELATNAAKYGALSRAGGIVHVDWHVEAGPKGRELVLTWREEGGPPVTGPTRKGFGSRLIEAGFSGTGGVEVRYRAEGLHATFRAALAFITR